MLGECENGQQAVAAIRQRRPDLIFLDIQMPLMNGFEVLHAIESERVPLVVFVTAYDDYAVKAFEVHAFDYLLKPFDRIRFSETVQRARTQLQQLQGGHLSQRLLSLLESLSGRRRGADRIAIKNGGHVVFVKTQSVDWVEAADNYVCLHCGTETHTLRETMNALETRSGPEPFCADSPVGYCERGPDQGTAAVVPRGLFGAAAGWHAVDAEPELPGAVEEYLIEVGVRERKGARLATLAFTELEGNGCAVFRVRPTCLA